MKECRKLELEMKIRSICLLMIVLANGCSTVKTTFMKVDPCGNLVESTGRCEHGVPIVVKTPTHIVVSIKQTDYYKKQGDVIERLPEATVREAVFDKIESSRLVMLDPKRPVSGTGKFSIKYDKFGNGTLTEAKYTAVDETIKNVGELVRAIVPKPKIGSFVPSDNSIQVFPSNERIVAEHTFPIEACSNGEIEAFVNQWINCGELDGFPHQSACYAK